MFIVREGGGGGWESLKEPDCNLCTLGFFTKNDYNDIDKFCFVLLCLFLSLFLVYSIKSSDFHNNSRTLSKEKKMEVLARFRFLFSVLFSF